MATKAKFMAGLRVFRARTPTSSQCHSMTRIVANSQRSVDDEEEAAIVTVRAPFKTPATGASLA
jgi:hypothetical protein